MTQVEQYILKNKVNIVKEIGPFSQDPKVLIAWMKQHSAERGNAITKVVTRMAKPGANGLSDLETIFSPVLSRTYPIMENVEFLKAQGVFNSIKIKVIESPELQEALKGLENTGKPNYINLIFNVLIGLAIVSIITLLLL